MRPLEYSLTVAVVLGAGLSAVQAADLPADKLAVGRRIYNEGVLPSGEPLRATINGDIPVDGTQFTCVSCHQRSGMGSVEGWQVAPPVTEAALYRRNHRRPAYTDETLASAIRLGVDPAQRDLASAMPTFDLDDGEMLALIHYLRSLSADISPGVTDEEVHFATVYTADADATEMLAVLDRFFEEKNAETRSETRRREHGPWFRDNRNLPYRKWVLHPWKLTGKPAGWRDQLERHYARQPVFALVSGMSTGTWSPVHEFCEDQRIPSILPNVDDPVISDTDFYTLYFSKGHVAEAETVAAHLSREPSIERVLQIYSPSPGGSASSSALRTVLARHPGIELFDAVLPPERKLGGRTLFRESERVGADAIVIWLPLDRLENGPWGRGMGRLPQIYLSSTLLGQDPASLPPSIRAHASLVHPFTLPAEFDRRFRYVGTWADARGIPIADRRTVGQTWFACMVLTEGLMHVRYENFHRDFLLESIDHTTRRIIPYSSQYPTPSFGPGQRYLSKGCYVLDLSRDFDQQLDPPWIVPR